jgi:Holliday junction resolvasome RuvABC endonuclease subunit
MKVIGLDLSLKGTGVCILEGEIEDAPVHRTRVIVRTRPKDVEGRIRLLASIVEEINVIFDEERPDYTIIEAPAKNMKWQAASIGEIHGVVKLQLWLAYKTVPMIKEATFLRRHIVGEIKSKMIDVTISRGKNKGKTKRKRSYGKVAAANGGMREASIKDIVAQRLKDDMGLEFPNHDEMDSYVTARYCWNAKATSGRKC